MNILELVGLVVLVVVGVTGILLATGIVKVEIKDFTVTRK